MKIALFGYGQTTKALSKVIKNCNIFDDKITDISKDEFNNTLMPSKLFQSKNFDLQITSPGIAPQNEMIKKADNLISEYDYFSDKMPFSIWVSGTNGKTTLTQMLYHLLSSFEASFGGNIGIALANMNQNAKIWILETSSFTLHYTKYAKPDIYILLPIFSDHISWHESFTNYELAKLKPLKLMSDKSIVIMPKKYENIDTLAYKICYENESDLAKMLNISTKDIIFKEPFLLDALLALMPSKILFDEINLDLLNTFKIDKHKIQELLDNKKRLWVNDSKATNIDASKAAIKRYKDKKIHLILGGDDKGMDLAEFFVFLQNFSLQIYAIGSNSLKIQNFCKKFDINCTLCHELEFALKQIDKNLQLNEVALLSPAASSLDQFNSYAHRGDNFINFVKKI